MQILTPFNEQVSFQKKEQKTQELKGGKKLPFSEVGEQLSCCTFSFLA